MGALAIIVNHTLKQYFYCDVCKWGEVFLNPYVMYGIIEFIRSRWNNHKLQFTNDYDLEKLRDLNYKKIELCWKIYREDFND